MPLISSESQQSTFKFGLSTLSLSLAVIKSHIDLSNLYVKTVNIVGRYLIVVIRSGLAEVGIVVGAELQLSILLLVIRLSRHTVSLHGVQ